MGIVLNLQSSKSQEPFMEYCAKDKTDEISMSFAYGENKS
jgi:hypothetical protein